MAEKADKLIGEIMPEVKSPTTPALIPDPAALLSSSKTTRPKTTLNLNGLFKSTVQPAQEEKAVQVEALADERVTRENLIKIWAEYAEQRKEQAAEYQFLKREIIFDYPAILITLTNPVEETLLENFRRDFIQFLRDRLKNSQLTIQGVLQASSDKKVIYTSKDKFDHLAEKNPYLRDLKDRLSLDWDF